MARRAQRLPVVPVPEQGLVAAMGLDVVDHLRLGTAERAARMKPQELGPRLLPFARIAALAAVRAGLVEPAFAFALELDLTGTKDAMRHDGTTGTEAGRLRHRGGLSGRAGHCG